MWHACNIWSKFNLLLFNLLQVSMSKWLSARTVWPLYVLRCFYLLYSMLVRWEVMVMALLFCAWTFSLFLCPSDFRSPFIPLINFVFLDLNLIAFPPTLIFYCSNLINFKYLTDEVRIAFRAYTIWAISTIHSFSMSKLLLYSSQLVIHACSSCKNYDEWIAALAMFFSSSSCVN